MSLAAMVFRLLWLRDVLTPAVGSLPELLWTRGEILSRPKLSPLLRDPRDPGRVGTGARRCPAAGWEPRREAPPS